MTNPEESTRTDHASGKSLAMSAVIGATVAVIALAVFILPAEYGVDPTGLGGALGLTDMNRAAEPTRSFEIVDVLGGNEQLREVEVPDFGEPIPLPNAAVHQDQDSPPESRTMEITIAADGETEIKTVLKANKVIVFSWHTDRGSIYSDFHGHDPEAGNEFWVRYKEHQEGSNDNGSLVAPFSGEHGWYWLNYNEFPVTVTLTITGYFDDIIDYSALF